MGIEGADIGIVFAIVVSSDDTGIIASVCCANGTSTKTHFMSAFLSRSSRAARASKGPPTTQLEELIDV